MTRRMAIAALALAGFFISLYLTLFKLGVVGSLSCAVGSCDTVNLSGWGTFLGLPVAAWGMGFYALTFAIAFAGAHDRWSGSRLVAPALVALTGWGIVFSAWLTWLELFVIHAICMWCVISAGIVAVMFGASIWEMRATRS
ncbi:MAG TPA: vitamin K epoxide reductase family protein [Gemmatimonadales bacterium]